MESIKGLASENARKLQHLLEIVHNHIEVSGYLSSVGMIVLIPRKILENEELTEYLVESLLERVNIATQDPIMASLWRQKPDPAYASMLRVIHLQPEQEIDHDTLVSKGSLRDNIAICIHGAKTFLDFCTQMRKQSKNVPVITFDRATGEGTIDGHAFKLMRGKQPHLLFAAMYENIGEPVDRGTVLELMGIRKQGDDRSVAMSQAQETRQINQAVSSLRKIVGLNANQLVLSGGSIILKAQK